MKNIMNRMFFLVVAMGFISGLINLAHASDSLNVKTIGLDLARDIAYESVEACRKQGYQVSAVVVDRNGLLQVALRDDLASRFTLQIAEEKANSVILSATSSAQLRANREDIRLELNHIKGIIVMRGGLPIEIAGSRIGAIGVSGAPGGDKDESCAQSALDSVSDRLDFAE
jgi:uncharacterized protein GlcG (DUF336 family)